jgi:hypothetical protein
MLKLSKTESITQFGGAGQCGSAVLGQCNAVLSVNVLGAATDLMETQGMFVTSNAVAPFSACNQCNSSGFRETISSTDPTLNEQGWLPSGGLIEVKDNSNHALSGVKGMEWDLDNNSNVDCSQNNGSAFGNCNGLIIVSKGTNLVSTAWQVRNGTQAFIDGGIFSASCCTLTDINDYSSATTAINLQGTHSNSILLASGAGAIGMGTNSITNVGSVSVINAQTTPRINALSDTSTGWFQSASGVWKYASGGVNIDTFDTGFTNTSGGIMSGAPTGGYKGTGTINSAGLYYANGTAGVSCGAGTVNLTTLVVTNGIVTHC